MLGASLVRPRAVAVCGLLCAVALAGCATQTKSAVTVSGKTLTIYLSQPPHAAQSQTAADVLDAEQLAFRQAGTKLGPFTLRYHDPLHGAELSDNARSAVQDKSAIAYLGEVVPGTSQETVPITNELGLLQVSPTDTAAYLTQATPAVSGSPGTFYPSSSTYGKTFARVVPTSAQEAKAITAEMHSLGLSKLYVSDDGSSYGASIAAEVRADAPKQGLSTASSAQAADAVFYGGNTPAAASRALDQAATAGSAKLFAPSALYSEAFAAGLSAGAQRNLYVSSPGFTASDLTPSGRQFVTAFTAAYGHAPVPEAIFGYEAASALIAVLKQAGSDAGSRATIVNDFRSLHNRQSVLGTYSISSGDTNIAPFVFGRLRGGRLVAGAQG
jgi:ABC-type branched-subunit amino acid transport system substrate-binding protein